jgi:hypothetical protein
MAGETALLAPGEVATNGSRIKGKRAEGRRASMNTLHLWVKVANGSWRWRMDLQSAMIPSHQHFHLSIVFFSFLHCSLGPIPLGFFFHFNLSFCIHPLFLSHNFSLMTFNFASTLVWNFLTCYAIDKMIHFSHLCWSFLLEYLWNIS